MTDTELQLIGQDDEYSYFNVFVNDKFDHVVCMKKVKTLRDTDPSFLSRFKHKKRLNP